MNMPSLQLLEALIAVSTSSSMALAAKELNLTQAALSMQLKKLEEMFDLPIFEFQGKRKILTPYGLSINNEAKKIIQEFKRSFETINRQYLNSEKQVLRVSGRREIILQAHKALDFKGIVSFSIMSSEQALQALYLKQTDIAIGRIKPDSPDLIAKQFFSDRPRLVVHEKWTKGASANSIIGNKDFFLKTPAIIYCERVAYFDEWLKYLRLEINQLNVKIICEDWLAILQMVEAGKGYAIIPDSIESNLKSVKHIELPKAVVAAEAYYFLFNRNLKSFPAYKQLFKS